MKPSRNENQRWKVSCYVFQATQGSTLQVSGNTLQKVEKFQEIHYLCISVLEQANLWGCERFVPEFPEKCSGKYLWKYFFPHRSWTRSFGMTSIKKHSCDSPHARHQFFKIKQRWAPFLPIFHEVHPNVHAFCEYFHRSSQIFTNFQGFCPDFRQIKPLGVALAHPAAPPPKPLPQHDIH